MEPNYSIMSLMELKQAAKGRRIKHYYVLKRIQLIQLLSMKELPEALRIEKLTIHELRDEARRRGLRGFWLLRRDRLVELLFPDYHQGDVHQATTYQNEQNESNTDKHNAPEQHDPQKIGVQNSENGLDNMDMNGVLDSRASQLV